MMDTVDPLRFVFAFLFVLGLIGLSAIALKRYTGTKLGKRLFAQAMFTSNQPGDRIQLLEMRYLDARRKLVLIRRDNREHLLLLADNRELVVESWDAEEDQNA